MSTAHDDHAFHGRVEDRRLVTGGGRYTSDWVEPGQAHAAFVRADRAHAEIRRIDVAAARAHPGVLAVLTAADIANEKLGQFPLNGQFNGRGGTTILRTSRPMLAGERVRFAGEPIAIVVATTEAAARDAADLVEIDYHELPVVASAAAALATGAPQLHANIPGNLCFDGETGDEAATAAAFARAHHVSRLSVRSDRVVGNPMEPRACTARYDASTETYHVHVPMQGVLPMRKQLSGLLNIDETKVMVEVNDVGGSFGIRSNAYQEYIAVMIAARRLGRPVKWVGTRSECFLTDSQGRSVAAAGELALDREGNFLAMRFDFTVDLGAYQSTTGPFTANNNLAHCMAGVYKTRALYGRIRLALTNTVPMAAYRGAGRPDVAYAIERLVDQAAHEMGIDPAALRRKNLIPKDAFPYKTPNATTYDSGDYVRGLDSAVQTAEWSSFAARRAEAKQRGKLRGIGMASFVEGTGAGNFPKDQARIEFERDGTVTLYTLSQTQGQSHETAYPMIVSEVLGIPREKITLRASVPNTTLIGNHTGGSRGTVGAGNALFVASERVLDIARRYAAEELNSELHDVKFAEGVFTAGAKSLSFEQLVRTLGEGLPAGEPHPLDLIGEGVWKQTYPNGTHIAEVEIDPDTGVIRAVRYTAVDDCGRVIDHTLVEGQLMGGITQGAGQVFGEQAIYDPTTGQLLSGSFMDYPMPKAGWLGDLTILDNGVPSPTNPLGIKGVGESGTTGSLPALVNAAMNALREAGVKHIDMPLTPAKVWAALHGRT